MCVWGLTPRDLSVAERLARYCHASYCDQAQVMQWDCLFCDSSAQQAKPLFFSRNESTHSTFFILKNDEFKESKLLILLRAQGSSRGCVQRHQNARHQRMGQECPVPEERSL